MTDFIQNSDINPTILTIFFNNPDVDFRIPSFFVLNDDADLRIQADFIQNTAVYSQDSHFFHNLADEIRTG